MNTTKRGNNFENRVYAYLQEALSQDNLFVPQKTSRIFQKKGYFSRDRQSDIITDISIETSIPGADEYSLLTIIECKGGNGTIPVDDMEEFHSKIQQIAGDNVKAIFVSTSALQKGALSYAQSKKIAVVRFLPMDQVEWVSYHMPPNRMEFLNPIEFNSAFTNQGHVGRNRSFYGCDELSIYSDLFSLLNGFLNRA
ncbi:restriction endonuclease [Parapedobacter sp. SGR-10]|uniref:restriction endonuclease n=1 Tax=Parapedobacter sp. SGR-10 TaxID=2710879 RepID=UPI0013D24F8C|nr:restriction endonuclease [Parapedobacter sp. SGR-10]NGF56771.1 restriction endonuclease [Parapedobacter sp. SGR-10]